MKDGAFGGGTGAKLTRATVIVAGVACLAASLVSLFSIWLQLKNYRKPLLQRYVVRILLIVPVYSAASWTSLWSLKAANWVDPIRDVYEAFTIYTFFQLLLNFLGGERSLIVMMHGRPPVHHLWPLNHCLNKVDISDPHTFLAIKRGILQYAWIKPILAVAAIIMKATDTYQEGYVGLRSGYFWSGIVYNISITVSLYSLAMFWVCMADDLQPFRPMPKFLSIKLIIFASYWQGFFLSILVWLGAIPDDVTGYTPDNIAAAIQNALICFELPAFAAGHWYAFSWHDYADVSISAARMPVLYALRDAFGVRDLVADTKATFAGKGYEYRLFDSVDDVLTHEDSESRMARMREGMRYERTGNRKYWIPKPGELNARTPLLGDDAVRGGPGLSPTKTSAGRDYCDVEPMEVNDDEEALYANARALEFGDWNYPVITAHEASREAWKSTQPDLITTATNRHLLYPDQHNRQKRQEEVISTVTKGKSRTVHSPVKAPAASRLPFLGAMMRSHSSSSSSAESHRSQLVDLVVEDTEAEEIDRVRARKEGGSRWNEDEQKHFVRTYQDPEDDVGASSKAESSQTAASRRDPTNGSAQSSNVRGQGADDARHPGDDAAAAEGADEVPISPQSIDYGEMDEERSAWSSRDKSGSGGPNEARG